MTAALALGLLLAVAGAARGAEVRSLAVCRIAFGSCNAHDRPQPMWDAIRDADPDLWVWTGDIVYADTEDMELMRAKYELQKSRPEYRRLATACEVIGIWDDHDYGANDGGRFYPRRAESQRLLLDFLDVSADSPRRRREGAYGAYLYGEGERRVKVVLLDARYHRDDPGPEADVLGPDQWRWLEEELAALDAELTLIVSGIQVVPEEHRYEKWANFPRARARLLDLVRRSRTPGVVFISGDRHLAEISRLDAEVAGYPLYDVTSSGLTHSWSSFPGEPNRHRVSGGVDTARADRGQTPRRRVAIAPSPDPPTGAIWAEGAPVSGVFSGLNYGLIEIDWGASPPAVELQIRDQHNEVRCRQRVTLPVLTPPALAPPTSLPTQPGDGLAPSRSGRRDAAGGAAGPIAPP